MRPMLPPRATSGAQKQRMIVILVSIVTLAIILMIILIIIVILTLVTIVLLVMVVPRSKQRDPDSKDLYGDLTIFPPAIISANPCITTNTLSFTPLARCSLNTNNSFLK